MSAPTPLPMSVAALEVMKLQFARRLNYENGNSNALHGVLTDVQQAASARSSAAYEAMRGGV